MIWFIEIPHQRPASCWAALDRAAAVDAIFLANSRSPELAEIENPTFEALVDWLAGDLSSLLVYETDDEALAALDDDDVWHRHGGARAYDALREKLIAHDLLTDDGLRPEVYTAVVALAMALWREQLANGMGGLDEEADEVWVEEWLLNRSYDWRGDLVAAAGGDAAALVRVRVEAGLPALV